MSEFVTASPAIDTYSNELDIETRPYQQRVLAKAIRMFDGEYEDHHGRRHEAADSVMIQSPTGSGKTIMGLLAARYYQQTLGFRVGWVAMRRNLLAQAAAENSSKKLNVDMELISMFEKSPPSVDLLVVDEAQHDAAMSVARLHSQVRPKKVLGLTATPYRTDRIKLCFQQVIQDVGIQQLIEEGYLSRYQHFTIPEYTPQSVADFYTAESDRWGKSLIFFHRTAQSLACQAELAQQGIRSHVVTAKSNREQQLEDFHEGRIDVLISMAILAEGFDCPSLKTVFCRPSGRGCTVQMGGRVFRRHPNLPFKQMVQCKNTRHPFSKTAKAEAEYAWMAGRWQALTVNKHLREISTNALRLVANSPAQLPDLVARHRPKRSRYRGMRGL